MKHVLQGLAGFLICLAFTILFAWATGLKSTRDYNQAYKQGQIDAINGKIKYELVESEYKTKQYELIEIEEK